MLRCPSLLLCLPHIDMLNLHTHVNEASTNDDDSLIINLWSSQALTVFPVRDSHDPEMFNQNVLSKSIESESYTKNNYEF